MLQAISKANHNSRFVYVMDTRPKVTPKQKPFPNTFARFINIRSVYFNSSCKKMKFFKCALCITGFNTTETVKKKKSYQKICNYFIFICPAVECVS